METIRPPKSAPNNKRRSKLSRTFHKVISLRAATKIASQNGICKLKPKAKVTKEDYDLEKMEDLKAKNRAIMEALLAKLFAGITSIKAAYAELQMAQDPYDDDAIQVADQAVVDELKAISELKRSFLKKELDLSPQVTLMLAEIQEQQALTKTYEITLRKLESESDRKSLTLSKLKSQLQEISMSNKSSESKLKHLSGPLSIFDDLRLSKLTATHFAQFHQQTIKSVRSFVRLLIKEMESAKWDLNAAVKFIEPEAEFSKQSHRCFAIESYVSRTMFQGFDEHNFKLDTSYKTHDDHRSFFLSEFNDLKSLDPRLFLSQNQTSSFAKFVRVKYMQLVHAKMECSLFGNLNQRKLLSSGDATPETPFFEAFVEMAMRAWLLHCLAFSYSQQVSIFQVGRGCRFSEVFMESTATVNDSDSGFYVGFTVVPGFKIGKMVFQSMVYLSPGTSIRRVND